MGRMYQSNEVMHGYYRFTDIFFEWHNALPNPEDVSPLKAMIAYEALVHPEHPLRKEGNDGIELYIGTFESGVSRLLFSSAQIEYIRYYIHAMGLTKGLIPIPSSEYLIRMSEMQSCSPVIYNDAQSLKKAIKVIDKNNKKLRGSEPLLTSRRLAFERVRTFWKDKAGTWLAIDFEAWEMEHDMITEFGWSSIHWEDEKEVRDDGHLIVAERRKYTNTKYVHGNRDHYMYGESEDVNKGTFKERIAELITRHSARGPLFLVFHDFSQDIKYLNHKDIAAPISNINYLLPEVTPKEGIYVVDTSDLFAALEGEGSTNKRSLQRAAHLLNVFIQFPHNAGNDAHMTLDILKEMASGDPVDAQREKRWPDRLSGTQPKAVFRPSDEDSDMSDPEEQVYVSDVRTMNVDVGDNTGFPSVWSVST